MLIIICLGELITKKDLNVVDNGKAMMSINIDGDDICSTGGSDKFYMPDWIWYSDYSFRKLK